MMMINSQKIKQPNLIPSADILPIRDNNKLKKKKTCNIHIIPQLLTRHSQVI